MQIVNKTQSISTNPLIKNSTLEYRLQIVTAACLSVSPKSGRRPSAETLTDPDRHLSIILPSAVSTRLRDRKAVSKEGAGGPEKQAKMQRLTCLCAKAKAFPWQGTPVGETDHPV